MVLFLFFATVIIIRIGTASGNFSYKTADKRTPYTAFAFMEQKA
jgi:hypothetical protein